MQFLVYLTILMVSISTVLLEIHWLTTPAPQPKPAVQASAPPPRPKVEGPSAALSPVYPKKLEPAQPAPSTQNKVQNTVDTAAPSNTAVKAEAAQKPVAETTGAAPRSDDRSKSQSAVPPDNAHNAQAYAAHLATPHFKQFRGTTDKMVKSRKRLDAVPIVLGAKATAAAPPR